MSKTNHEFTESITLSTFCMRECTVVENYDFKWICYFSFIYFWLPRVFVALHGLCLVAESRDYSLLRVTELERHRL